MADENKLEEFRRFRERMDTLNAQATPRLEPESAR